MWDRWETLKRAQSVRGVNVEIPPFVYLEPNSQRGHCMVGSLTGVVASKRVTEAFFALSTLGNRAQSVLA